MRVSTVLALVLAASPVAAVAADVQLTPNPSAPPIDERTPAQKEAERLAFYKLEPITAVAAAKREVRRASFTDISESITDPAVVFEKMPDGKVAMTVISDNARRIDRAVLKPEAWAYITKKDAFALPRPKPAPVDAPICHGSTTVIEAAQGGKTARYDAAICNGVRDTPAILYGRNLAQVAVDSIPRCAPFREAAREASWVLNECLKRTAGYGGQGLYALFSNPNNVLGDHTEFALSTSTEGTDKLVGPTQR